MGKANNAGHKKIRVLLCERKFDGHRKKYFAELAKCNDVDMYGFAPENVGIQDDRFTHFIHKTDLSRLREYLNWAQQIRNLVDRYDIDIVHILDGDSIRKYCGIGLPDFRKCKVIMTLHHFFSGYLSYCSYKVMARKCHFIVHTDSIANSFKKNITSNISCINYPAFDMDVFSNLDCNECKNFYQLKKEPPTIGIIGGLNRYKNIIPFLHALKEIKSDFQLLICGQENDISKEDICKAIGEYPEKVRMLVRRLTSEEYQKAIGASDIVYALYGKEFDGASGPLTDGVCGKKYILACSHGSLGDIVTKYHLGTVADCDNSDDVCEAIEIALKKVRRFKYDCKAQGYRDYLSPLVFRKVYVRQYNILSNKDYLF